MATKKDDILLMLAEGKTIDDIVNNGFNRKYVNEVIRNSKGSNSNTLNTEAHVENSDVSETKKDNEILCLHKDIENIKKILNYDIQKINTDNKIESKKKQFVEAIKMLQFIVSNEQLLQYISLNINIAVTDSGVKDIFTKSIKSTEQRPKINYEKINPIAVYREEGEVALKNILQECRINELKNIARQYTPDTRGYVYKWNDSSKIINYIVERASSLSEKGSVFVSDSQ